MSQGSGTKRPERAKRYKPFPLIEGQSYAEHINALGMVCSLLGLLMRMKIASWVGVYCSVVYLANSGAGGDMKQTLSLIMLSMSSLVMVYMQNPSPLTLNY